MRSERQEKLSMRELLPLEIEHSLRAVLGAVDYGVLVTDLEHQSLICNGRFGELFDISAKKVVSNDVESVRKMVYHRIVDTERWHRNLEDVYNNTETEQEDELILKNPDMVLRRYTGPVRNEDKVVVARLWTFLDISAGARKRNCQSALSDIALHFDHDPTLVVKKIIDTIAKHYGSVAILSILNDNFMRFHTVSGAPPDAPQIAGNYLAESYCQFCLAASEPLIIQDSRLDARSRDMFPASLGLTRYAGVPIYDLDGNAIGTLCILDSRSDVHLDGDDLHFLSLLAMRISSELERESRILQLEEGLKDTSQELKYAQDKLVQSEKLAVAGTLAASIAHDIRNILSSINVQISLGVDEPQKALDYVGDSLGRFNVLAHRLLSYAKPHQAVLEHLDLCSVLEKVLSLIGAQFEISKVELVSKVPDTAVFVKGDEGRLEHLVVNLLLNSLNAVRAKGKVTVTIESNGESIDLSVMDNGQGMTPEVREQLFQPFATTRSNGFGLGLFSCMQIAREHGATIECNSELGQGTTMKVSFPRTT
jgi:signal transduction histidine kinase